MFRLTRSGSVLAIAALGMALQAGAARLEAGPPTGVTIEEVNAQPRPEFRADFNGDGILDTVSSHPYIFNALTVVLGETQQAFTIYAGGSDEFGGVSLVSFNADGSYPSLVFAVNQELSSPSTQRLWLNAFASGGGFVDTPVSGLSLIGTDVSCTREYPGRELPVCFFAERAPGSNGEGRSKLVALNSNGTVAEDLTAQMMLFGGAAVFPSSNRLAGQFMHGAAFHDFTGDGRPDLMAVGQHSMVLFCAAQQAGAMNCSWFDPPGTGQEGLREYLRVFTPAGADLAPRWAPACAYLGREEQGPPDYVLCHDPANSGWSVLDLPVASYSSRHVVRFWAEEHGLHFTAATAFSGGQTNRYGLVGGAPLEAEAAWDFDGDRRAQVFWRHTTGANTIWRMDGNTYVSYSSLPSLDPSWQPHASGDFDGDGRWDLVWRHASSGTVCVWLMDGADVRRSGCPASVPDAAWKVVASRDFDEDGRTDLVWHNEITGQVYLWSMFGTRSSRVASVGSVPDTDWRIVGSGDLDGNGTGDLVWRNRTSGEVYLWRMRAEVALAYPRLGNMPESVRLAVGRDFDGDGTADLLWHDQLGMGALQLWKVEGGSVVADTLVTNVPPGDWRLATAGNYDGGGTTDLVWQHRTNTSVYGWLMAGSVLTSYAQLPLTDQAWQAVDTP